jgi:8-oxo-dGTP pyrophosphatase MutT (NUDIX family)
MNEYFGSIENDPLVRYLKNLLPPEPANVNAEKKYRVAAVILPLINRNNKWNVIFTKRTESVDHHRGEFSFPGGLVEEQDRDSKSAALRETEEEMGVKKDDIWILGALSPELTAVSYFLIHPYVGILSRDVNFKINSQEIDRILEIPLEELLFMKDVREEIFEDKGRKFRVYFYNYHGDVIWGATGRILKQFLDIIRNMK